jgi:XTP/dITP diphosphohydrolase
VSGPLVALRTGPWRGTPLLTGPAWRTVHEAGVVVGLHSDPYAVGLARELPVTLVDRPQALDRDWAPRPVVMLDSGRDAGLTAYLDGRSDMQVVDGEPVLRGLGLLDVVAVMDRLRSPGGCPWDAQQTHESLRPYLLEEAHEAADAIDSGDLAHLAEELGDVLLQVAFHARIGQEGTDHPFDIDDVAVALVAKLVRRHPHVFGDVVADTAEHVAANWERIKAAEKAHPGEPV